MIFAKKKWGKETPQKKLFQKIIFSQFQFRPKTNKKSKRIAPPQKKNFPAKKINFSQIQFRSKTKKMSTPSGERDI